MAKTSEYPDIIDPTGAKLLATTAGGAVGNVAVDKFARSNAAIVSVQNGPGISIDNADPLNPIVGLDTDSVFDKVTDDLDDIGDGSTYKRMTAAEKAKIDLLTVTGAVDLDAIDTKLNGIEAGADVTDAANVTGVFGTIKASIVDDDRLAGMDSAAANAPKYWLFSVIKSTLKTYFDSLYVAAFADPGADRIVFWDDSANAFAPLTIGTNLSISGTTLNASGGGGGGGGDMDTAIYDPNAVASDAFDMDNMVEGTTTKILTGAERTKLSGIEASADVTDAANVAAAGAFMKASDDLDDITAGATNKHFTATEQTKLAGIATGADVTSTALADAAGVSIGSAYGGVTDYGYVNIAVGNTTLPGLVGFYSPDGTRRGYAGWANGNYLTLSGDNGWGWRCSDFYADVLQIGHASDSTISRASAGVLAVEGNNILTANVIGTAVQAYDAGNAPVIGKQAIFIPAIAMIARTTNGAAPFSTELATNDVMIRGYDFDTSTSEAIQALVALPKQWNEGTVTFRAYWTAASGSGGVAFSLKARGASDDDAMDGAWGTGVTVTDTFITANDLHVTAESSAITIGGSPAEGDMIWIEVAREVANGSDTLAVDARLLGIEFFITTNAGTDA